MLEEISTRAPKSADKDKYKQQLQGIVAEISDLQNLLFAENKHAILVVIQGMDASGKDGLIRDVFGGINPQGVQVHSFKAPTPEELEHDFLWRIHQRTPAKGMINVFNRSHYEDVLITRVHGWVDDATAKKRMAAINHFEKLLVEHNNTHILKLYLHVSKKEQLERLKERMSIPEKMWKYNENDFVESQLWDKYMMYYEEVLRQCDAPPWHVIPSDQNWYKSHVVAVLLRDTLRKLKMQYPGMKK